MSIGVAPEIMSALAEANRGPSMPYGNDDWTRRVERKLADIFEREVRVFPVATGTAANALSLATLAPPYGVDLRARGSACDGRRVRRAGILFSGGAKLRPLAGAHGKLSAEVLDRALTRDGSGDVAPGDRPPPSASPRRPRPAPSIARRRCRRSPRWRARHKVRLHMDGARFANAMAFLGVPATAGDLGGGHRRRSPSAPARAAAWRRRRWCSSTRRWPRASATGACAPGISSPRCASSRPSSRPIFADGLWLKLARHANAMAQRLAQGLTATLPRLPGAQLLHPVEANELFVQLPAGVIAGLRQAGSEFYDWPAEEGQAIRLVTAFNTEAAHVEQLLKTLGELIGRAA